MTPDTPDAANNPPPAPRPFAGHLTPYVRGVARPATSVSENQISHTFVLWVLRQWWMIVIPTGLALAGIAAAMVILNYTPKFEATALLMIEDSTPFVAFSARELDHQSRRYVQTQLELLRSPVVLEPVLSREEVATLRELLDARDRVTFLRDRMSIKQVGQSELYNISYTSQSPQAAADVVNAVIAEYMTIHLSDEFQRSQRVVDILEEERRRRGLEVERLRKNVVKLAADVTGRDPFGGHEVDFNRALSPVGALFQSLTEADVEREVLRAELTSLTDASDLPDVAIESSGLLDLQVEANEGIRARQKAIADFEAQLEKIKSEALRYETNPQLDGKPNYVALKNELTLRQKELNDAKIKVRDVIVAQAKDKREAARAEQIAKMKRELESLDARNELLKKRFDQQVRELQSGGAKSVELEFARAELEREERVFEMIASRKLALQTELRAPARVQLRKKANVPTVAVEPVPYKLLFLACSAAFAAPFGLALVREITVRRINDVEQLAQESGLRVLGEVAALPVRYLAVSPHQISERTRRNTYIFAESINSLRTNLALANGLDDHRVFAITSATSGEGKTSVGVSLALSIANASKTSILLIDGDMRSPAVAAMLKAKSQPGLFDLLSKKCKLDDAIHRTGHDGLHVIPAGRATTNTPSVVRISEIKQLLDQLCARYSTILIDTPPILGASESLVLAKAVDSVLFCALCDVSKAKQVRRAIDRLVNAQVNIAGAVLSGTPARRYEHVYGYYANRIEAAE